MNRLSHFVFLIVLLWAFHIPGQAQESNLEQNLKVWRNNTSSIQQKVVVGQDIAVYYLNRNLDSALFYYKVLDTITTQINDPNLRIETILAYSKALQLHIEHFNSLQKAKEGILIAEKHHLTDQKIRLLNVLGAAHSLSNNVDSAQTYFDQALELSKSIKDTALICYSYTRKGECYRRFVMPKEGLVYLRKALEIDRISNLPVSIKITIYNRMAALIAESKGPKDSVWFYSNKCLELAKEVGDSATMASSYTEIAYGDTSISRAWDYYQRAKRIYDNLGYVRDEARVTYHLSNFERNNQLSSREHRFNRTITVFNKFSPNNTWEYKANLNNLLNYYEYKNDYKNQIRLHKIKYKVKGDQVIFLAGTKLKEVQSKYDYEKAQISLAMEQLERKKEQAESAKKDLLNKGYILAVCVLILILLVLFFFFRTLRKKNGQLNGLISDKDVLLKEINHRVKNNMLMVSSILELQQESDENELIKSRLQIGIDRVRSLTYAHQQLYQTENYTEIELNKYLIQIVENLAMDPTVDVSTDFDQILMVSIEKAQPIGFVINELITNSLKYAWEGESTSDKQIRIKLYKTDAFCHLEIRDNGVGFPEEFDSNDNSGLGFMLVNSFVNRQLGGSIELKNDEGAVVLIKCQIN